MFGYKKYIEALLKNDEAGVDFYIFLTDSM